jgi:hypothetical protein
MIYTVYLELYSKKMKVEIEADSAKAAMAQVREAIVFHKVQRIPEPSDETLNDLLNLFGMKGKR